MKKISVFCSMSKARSFSRISPTPSSIAAIIASACRRSNGKCAGVLENHGSGDSSGT